MRSFLLTVAYRLAVQWWRIRRPVSMGVRVMLVQEGRVMLVKHTYQDEWYFPGGGVKRDEPVEAAARREAAEEVGAVIGDQPGAMRLVGVFANFTDYKSDHVVCFLSETFTLGDRPPSPEIADARFFPLDALPAGTSPGTRRKVAAYRAGTLGSVGKW
ncbi:MAG: NUDIX domain-containing protein [Caldilineaceae bacterium]|nr:NUDIX domain-containing protein [Caldilineaceae bacterium]MBP8110389.1 NUDIX domain-containing protein [Caldilineaceae bacterium]MBP8124789.1 NUDIX domain-containing protein [Caldilineaceae bacterium]MBP9074714.1 NUDIX domain-containing protein [Caldilineaceae bacterium]